MRHSGWSRTPKGERSSSGGKPAKKTRILDGQIVDSDGVPRRYTSRSAQEIPEGLMDAIRAGKPLDRWLND